MCFLLVEGVMSTRAEHCLLSFCEVGVLVIRVLALGECWQLMIMPMGLGSQDAGVIYTIQGP